MQYSIQGLAKFIRESPVPFYTVNNIKSILKLYGFVELQENKSWEIKPNGKYYVTRNGSAIIAFCVPDCGFAPILATASHSDSPMFRIKPIPELTQQGEYVTLNSERYGGMILSTWMDRPLSVAGRVIVRTETGLKAKLVNINRDIALIPNLAIHMNRDVNDGYKFNAQTDMMALFGDISVKGKFEKLICEAAGVGAYLGSDLYLYNRMEPKIWGMDDEYISAPRIDDLECVYTTLAGFINAGPGEHINMYCVFDNEEVGSGTRQGADSTFFYDVIMRMSDGLGATAEEARAALASGFLVSADNAQALHPTHPEKSDAVNRPLMNRGIVIKYSANQKYTSDGMTGAIFSEICRRASIPTQVYTNRSDVIGGSTLGNISGAHVSIPTVDIGLAQLAMHSSYETAGVLDAEYMVRAIKRFYQTELRMNEDMNFNF